jgi:anti-anti-sigma regulatory factor
MATRSTTTVSRTSSGYRIRVEGRGTLRESPAVHALARQVLESEPGTLVLNLEGCDYLDSTYLGALVDLQRRFGFDVPGRFVVVAQPLVRQRLFGPNCLEELFCYGEDLPELVGEEVEFTAHVLERDDLGRYVLECHRRLAELNGPNRAAMQGVVDRLAEELLGS